VAKENGCEDFRVVINNGKQACKCKQAQTAVLNEARISGQSVYHLHVHVIGASVRYACAHSCR
jgi:hypothetical protein